MKPSILDQDVAPNPIDARLALAEHQLWVLVANHGPKPEISELLDRGLSGQPPTAATLADEATADLWDQVVGLAEAGQATRARKLLGESFRLAKLVWQAYQDGYEAGVASVVTATTEERAAMTGYYAPLYPIHDEPPSGL